MFEDCNLSFIIRLVNKNMKKNKLKVSNTPLKRFSSSDLVITQQVFPSSSKNRYISQNPLIFSLQAKVNNKFDSFNPTLSTYYGVFSIQKTNSTKIREQRQDFQRIKSKSFNIKKIIDKSIKEEHVLRDFKKPVKPLANQFEIKLDSLQNNNRRKYVYSKFKQYEISDQLTSMNKNLGVIINRAKQNKSELVERRNSRLLYRKDKPNEESLDKNLSKERTIYFVNNFIKTKIKTKPKIQQQDILIKTSYKKNPELNVVDKQQLQGEGNWMLPWQKGHDTEQDTFMQN